MRQQVRDEARYSQENYVWWMHVLERSGPSISEKDQKITSRSFFVRKETATVRLD